MANELDATTRLGTNEVSNPLGRGANQTGKERLGRGGKVLRGDRRRRRVIGGSPGVTGGPSGVVVVRRRRR